MAQTDNVPHYADGQEAHVGDLVECAHVILYAREVSADGKWVRIGCRGVEGCPLDYWELAEKLETVGPHA